MQHAGMVSSKADIGTYINTAIYKAALDGLAKENPKDAYWQKLKKQFAERDA
jgi:hypothetical protein